MYLQRNEGIPDQVDLGSIYDSYEGLKEENTEIRQIYESQKLENVSKKTLMMSQFCNDVTVT